jgi:hypothetical protein
VLYQTHYIRSLILIRKTLIIISLFVFFGQMLLDAGFENIVSNLFALTAFLIACFVVFSHRNISIGSALSATVIFLMVSANSLAPMLGTLLEGHPIIETLTVPVQVFAHRLVFALCLVFAHYLSCSPSSLYIREAVSKVSKKLSSKVTLPSKSLWALGLLGLAALILKFFHMPSIVNKLLDGFVYLMMAPFLMLLPPYNTKALMKKQRVWLILFYLLQVSFSFAFNSRMGMVLPVGIVAASWLFSLLTGHIVITQKSIQTGVIRGIVGLFLLGQFADLSTAILIERAQRDTRSGLEQAKATIDRFMDKKAIADYHAQQLEIVGSALASQQWQENYVRNPFLARFIQVKFDDKCLYRIGYLKGSDFDELRTVAFNKVMVSLPQPVLNIFSLKIDKTYINSFSIGDEIDNLYCGANPGFKTGSIPSHAFALFWWWYPPILILIYYMVFSIYHGFFSPFKLKTTYGQHVPTLSLLLTFTIYLDISLDGVDALLETLTRGIIQRVLLYAIAIWIIKKIRFPTNMFNKPVEEIIPLNANS